jgi:hypothetical protein
MIRPNSKVYKVYVKPDNTAVLTCPQCGRQKVILADSFKGHRYKPELKIKCNCQNVFRVNLEFRKGDRKITFLEGTYINHSQKGSSGYLTIHDISVVGMGFSSLDKNNFRLGDELSVEFTLDEHKTEIKIEVIVRSIRQNTTGCEFIGPTEAISSSLRYYIMHKLIGITLPLIISIHPFLFS